MTRSLLALLTLVALPALAQENKGPAAADAFLSPTALHVFHFKLTKPAWDKMQPTRGGLFSGLFPATRPAGEEATHDSPFGYHYAYVHADLELGDRTYANVGLRYKGNSSYLTGQNLKKPFKLDVDHFDKAASLAGLTSFNLNNNAMDPTFMREAMSYQFFRDAGVPASRTAWALVYLTVDTLHDRKLAGLYTVVEEVNKPFMKAHFGTAKGLLLKPENAFNLPYLGEEFAKYEKIYRPKSEATPETSKRLVDFIKLIHKADDDTFDRTIEQYLDVDGFLRFVAANSLLGNMDSFLSTGHNFYLYVHPRTLKAHFIPWDLNLSFGTFDWVGTVADQTDLSLRQPYVKPNRLTERVLAIDRYARAYRAEVARIASTCMTGEHVGPQIAAMQETIAKAERVANVPHKALPTTRAAELDLAKFMAARVRSVQGQLAGTAEGYAPYWQRGFFGGGGGKPAATRPTTRPAPSTTQPSTGAAKK